MSTKKAIILLSGGLDSAYNLAAAAERYAGLLVALFVDYGQKAAKMERIASQMLAAKYGAEFTEIDCAWLGGLGANALTDNRNDIPSIEQTNLDDKNITADTMAAVWVPNRNGVLVNIAAAIAESLKIPNIVVGFNAEEAATFPDNSRAYLEALNLSLSFSTRNRVAVESFSIDLNKTEIVAEAKKLNFPFSMIWSCYGPGPNPCNECESCRRLARALEVRA